MPIPLAPADFEPSWQRARDAMALRGTDAALLEQLMARYAEPHRKYHTLQHLGECLAMFESYPGEPQHPGEVEIALWFHDAIYDIASHDNEKRSADWARMELLAAGSTEAAATRVHELVLATRHDALPHTPDAQLLVDIDLSILGASPGRFGKYEAQVREEYAAVPDDVFRLERRKILLGFLGRPAIYATPHFHALLEARARENLARSIANL